MSVSEDQRGNVSSKSNPRAFYISRDFQQNYALPSIYATAAAGEYILYMRNTSTTQNIFVKDIVFGSANAALFKITEVSGTPSGSEIIAKNTNLTSGRAASISSYGNGAVTGLSAVGPAMPVRTSANGHEHEELEDALILGPGNAIAVEYDTGTTGPAEVTVYFHFEDISRAN